MSKKNIWRKSLVKSVILDLKVAEEWKPEGLTVAELTVILTDCEEPGLPIQDHIQRICQDLTCSGRLALSYGRYMLKAKTPVVKTIICGKIKRRKRRKHRSIDDTWEPLS